MNISVIGSTKVGHFLSKEEAIDFSGKSAGICYLPDTVETLFNEPAEKTLRRVENNIASGHHSVFGHPTYNLCLEGIPKILAMVLNNEKVYNTSEKSARYTRMEPSVEEKELYEKWIEIYKKEILKKYPNFDEKRAQKLAQENARYLISVFTPATIMEYTINFEQLNYIIGFARKYISNEGNDEFSFKLRKVFKDFLYEMPALEVEGLNADMKNRKFSLFSNSGKRKEEFGENYSVNYLASFAQLAQAQRHRTLYYEMKLLDKAQFYVPPIIRYTELETQWLKDISSLEHYYPQGMLVQVNERGTIENFVQKCTERLCGCAQLEIMEQTKITMKRYLEALFVTKQAELYDYLSPYSKGARCTFPNWKCNSPCIFGGKNAMTRYI